MTAGGVLEVDVQAIPLDRLAIVLGPERAEIFSRVAEIARSSLLGRRVVNVNSTATGGGVAELLQTLLAYARGVGVDARWVVIDGDAGFFEITKRIHNQLYGTPGDGGPLGRAEQPRVRATIAAETFDRLRAAASPDDIVILHDPQTAGLAQCLVAAGVRVVWRCHVGIDTQNEHSETAWEFLRPYLEHVEAFVFSRAEFAPPWVPRDRLAVIPPSIDPFSAKNEWHEPEHVTRLLQHVGLLAGAATGDPISFTRRDGTRGQSRTRSTCSAPARRPPPTVPIVLQASRWDAMKDMRGVMTDSPIGRSVHRCAPRARRARSEWRRRRPRSRGGARECLEAWAGLPRPSAGASTSRASRWPTVTKRPRSVNALQRHATVVVQKSLAEGFGLTVDRGDVEVAARRRQHGRRHRRPDHPRQRPDWLVGRARSRRVRGRRVHHARRRGAVGAHGGRREGPSGRGVPRRPPSRAVGALFERLA